MKTIGLIFAASFLFLGTAYPQTSANGPTSTVQVQQTDQRESVIASLTVIFGQPFDKEALKFQIAQNLTLKPSFTADGQLSRIAVERRYKSQPGGLSHVEFADLLAKLESIYAIGTLEEDGGGFHEGGRMMHSELHQHAYLELVEVIGMKADRTLQSADIYYFHPVSGVTKLPRGSGPLSEGGLPPFALVCVNGSSYKAPRSELLLLEPNQSQTLNLAGPMEDSGCEPPDALAVHEITCGMPFPVQDVPEPEPVLQKNHIPLSKDALIAALQSKAVQVRLAAADALAARWPNEVVSPIESALRSEGDETARIDLAFILAKLGKRNALSNLCHSPREWGSTRIQAAMMMCQLKDDSCVDSVMKILQRKNDPDDPRAKWNAMELVPSFIGHLSKQEADRVLALVVDALEDSSEEIRIVASQTINELGYLPAIPKLEAAIAKEQDENTRAQMEGELDWLKQTQKAHCEHGLSTDGRCFAPPSRQ